MKDMKNILVFLFLLVSILVIQDLNAFAQELLPPDDDIEEYSEEDSLEEDEIDNEENFEDDSEDLNEENFEDEEEPSKENDEFQDDGFETHLLKFEFRSKVEFFDHENGGASGGFPYLEIEYKTEFETTLDVTRKKQNLEMDSIYSIENWGSLAKNEFFDCRLQIELSSLPVSIKTSKKDSKNDEGSSSFSMNIKFDKNIVEDWFAFCTDISGDTLNTKGEKENYLIQVINKIEPSINKLLIDDFIQDEYYEYDLKVEPTIIDDEDLANDIVLSGEGVLSLEPL